MNIFPQYRNHLRLLDAVKLTVAILTITLALNTPALADPQHSGRNDTSRDRGRHMHNDRDWREHESRATRYWRSPRYARQPEVIYAPPLIYAPQPIYQQPGLNFIIPLYIN